MEPAVSQEVPSRETDGSFFLFPFNYVILNGGGWGCSGGQSRSSKAGAPEQSRQVKKIQCYHGYRTILWLLGIRRLSLPILYGCGRPVPNCNVCVGRGLPHELRWIQCSPPGSSGEVITAFKKEPLPNRRAAGI